MIKKLLVLTMLFSVATTSSYAFIVSAPAVEAQLMALNTKTAMGEVNRRAEFMRTIDQWVKQYSQMRDMIAQGQEDFNRAKGEFDYWKNIKGNWRDVVEKVRNAASHDALTNADFCKTPTMGASGLYTDQSTGKVIGETIDKLNQFLKAKEDPKSLLTADGLRNSIQTIVGYMPETSTSAVSAMSQTSIEETALFLGKANKAIQDITTEKGRIQQMMETNPTLTEAQIKKYEVAQNNLDQQMQGINTQAMLKISQLLMVDQAYKTQAYNQKEQRAIDERDRAGAFTTLIKK